MTMSSIRTGEYGSDVIEPLHQTIKKFSEESSRQTATMIRQAARMIWLTWTIAGLTFVMLIAVIVQIAVALR